MFFVHCNTGRSHNHMPFLLNKEYIHVQLDLKRDFMSSKVSEETPERNMNQDFFLKTLRGEDTLPWKPSLSSPSRGSPRFRWCWRAAPASWRQAATCSCCAASSPSARHRYIHAFVYSQNKYNVQEHKYKSFTLNFEMSELTSVDPEHVTKLKTKGRSKMLFIYLHILMLHFRLNWIFSHVCTALSLSTMRCRW